jgi:LAO/AO transport system kinase
VVVLTPNLGDGVQMIKAGILEIADIFVVNKADLDGHVRVATELRSMLSLASPALGGPRKAWKVPIIATVASRQEGIDELWDEVLAHRRHLESTGRAGELADQRLIDETAEVVAELARQSARHALAEDRGLAAALLKDGTPYRTAEKILNLSPKRAGRRKPRP